MPTLAGLLLAFLVFRFFPRVRGSGVQTDAAVYIYDGYIPFDTVIGKFLMCALAIGSGQSLGPEDPSLQMGAGMASALGRRLHLSRENPFDRAGWCGGGSGGGIQRANFGGAFCDRRGDRHLERRNFGRGGAGGGGRGVVSRLFLGADRCFKFRPIAWRTPPNWLPMQCWEWWAVASLLFAKLLIGSHADPGCRAGRFTFNRLLQGCHRNHRLEISASDGRGIRIHGPGHARPIFVAILLALRC